MGNDRDTNFPYPQVEVNRKGGQENLYHDDKVLKAKLIDFWRWSASDLASNAMRGTFAEFIVGSALGVVDGVRSEWEPYDLRTPSGIRVEVKSAAYLQSWPQKKLSPIAFSIRPARAWDSAAGLLSDEVKRHADVYVFCVLNHKHQESLDPLNIDQWDFYILSSRALDHYIPAQKSIGLAGLLALHPCSPRYNELPHDIELTARMDKDHPER